MNSMHSMPLRADDMRMLRLDDECLICDVEGRPLYALNDTASALWELCDGSTRFDEIVDAICAVCAIDPGQAIDDIRRTLADFDRAGLIRWE